MSAATTALELLLESELLQGSKAPAMAGTSSELQSRACMKKKLKIEQTTPGFARRA